MHFCKISSKFSFYSFVHTFISFHYIYCLLNFKLNKLTSQNEFFCNQDHIKLFFLLFIQKGSYRILIDIKFHDKTLIFFFDASIINLKTYHSTILCIKIIFQEHKYTILTYTFIWISINHISTISIRVSVLYSIVPITLFSSLQN